VTPPTVLVTGAARGIGAATVELFADRGWQTVGLDREWGGRAVGATVSLDITDDEALIGAIEDIPQLDALVNNAGIMRDARIAELTPSELSTILETNLRAAIIAVRAAKPALSRSRGAVVNVASVHALSSRSGASAYAASKAGLLGFTRAAAVELAPEQIRVNAVVPGAVDTGMLTRNAGNERDAALARLAKRTPLRRIGQPREVAEATYFLAGESSSFVTGQTLVVDGGAMAKLATE
jgi:NAD(P)-dependent dehydrogenase (short-subunit alcohol dehydrogenase family)